MSSKQFTFLSTRGRGLGVDMALLKNYLSQAHGDNINFRFYLKNEMHKNPMVAHGYRRAKKEFCEQAGNIICMDPSLNTGMRRNMGEGARIMLSVPYDYQFKNMLTLEKGNSLNLNTLGAFEYIFCGSPFSQRLLRNAYREQENQTLLPVVLPFCWDLLQEEKKRKIMEKIAYYFPQAARRKIVSILVYGDEEKKRKDWENFDVKMFLKQLGEDVFVFTNSELLMENAFSLSSNYQKNFGYVNRILPVQELLYVSDTLVTNNGRFAASFAYRNRPIWVCAYNQNWFEKYMQQCYPDMFLVSAEQMNEKLIQDELSQEQKKFCKDMVYTDMKSPYDSIDDIMGM